MGTRAIYYLGDPRNKEDRVFLGSKDWDGYPSGDNEVLRGVTNKQDFVNKVQSLDGFNPDTKYFPYPWSDDLFLTDCVYAFFDSKVHLDWSRKKFILFDDYFTLTEKDREDLDKLPTDVSFINVHSGLKWRGQNKDQSVIRLSF